MAKTCQEKESTVTADVDNQAAGIGVLRAVCDLPLKRSFAEKIREVGFKHETDAIITLVRDFIAGRIKYKSGILQSQENSI